MACAAATAIAAAQERPAERVLPAPEVNANAVVWRTPAPPPNPQPGDIWVNPKAGMDMVYIAAGQFTLGSSDADLDAWLSAHPGDERRWLADEQPQCRVYLPGYWIGRTEVTNTQYLRFVQATGHRPPQHWQGGRVPAGLGNHPVVYVDREDARAFCRWAGGYLPKELEWEKAARGTDGRVFPWGNEWDARKCRSLEVVLGRRNASPGELAAARDAWLTAHDAVREGPAPVGSHASDSSPYGCLDMAGNVEEWCTDWYDDRAYVRYQAGQTTPPSTGERGVHRGGSWFDPKDEFYRCPYRNYVGTSGRNECSGFRCALAHE